MMLGRRLGVGLVAVVVAGCSTGGTENRDGAPEAGEEQETADEVNAVEAVDPDEIEVVTVGVEHIGIDVEVVGAVGGVLLAYDNDDGNRVVVRSTDLGATWAPVTLPDAPRFLDVRLHVEDGVAVIGGVTLDGPGVPYLWTSSDGADWQGGPADGTVPAGGVRDLYDVWRQDDGRYVGLVTSVTDQVVAVVVSDDGSSWVVGGCPEESLVDSLCTPVTTIGDLTVTGASRDAGTVSLDRGRHWQAPTLDPDPGADVTADRAPVISAVDLPGGGWLGTATWWDTSVLVRSDDGSHWEQLIHPDPCERLGRPGGANDTGRRSTYYDGPVAFGDRWLVTYSCFVDHAHQGSELLVVDAGGTDPAAVDGSRITGPDLTYGSLVAVGDAVLVHTAASGVPSGDALVLRP